MSKSFEAVSSPHKFIPSIIKDNMDFEHLWQTKQAFIFSSLAHIAYFNKIKIKTFMERLGAEKTFFYNNEGAQAFLSIWKNKAVLTFRGTQPIEGSGKHHRKLGFFKKFRIKYFLKLKLDPLSLIFINNDILADLNFIPTSFDDMNDVNVHSGFLDELNKLWDNIIRDINQHIKNIPLWVAGHSLGGAMATLAGMRHSFEGVTTFGEPRVGSNVGKAFKSKNHNRYVNGDDPVTEVPPEFLFDYEHHGNLMPVRDEDGTTNMMYDHSIIYYSENLNL